MKKILLTLAAVAMVFAGCTKGIDERLTNLENRVTELEVFVANLNAGVQGIQAIVSNLQNKVYVTGVEPIKNESGVEIGYKITFNQGNPIEIKHGNKGDVGATGASGKTPSIDMAEDGNWYWRWLGGDWITDSNGKKIPVYKSIEFEVVDGHLYVKIDGATAIDLGVVQGPQGEAGQNGEHGDSWFENVTVDEEAGTVTIDVVGTDNDLVLPFVAASEDGFEFKVSVPENTSAFAGTTIEINYTVSEAAAATTVVRAYPSKGLEAVVDRENNKVVVTLSTVAGYVDLYAINNATGDIKAQTVDIAAGETLQVNVTETELVLAPNGTGSVEIPVSTVVDYVVEVPTWATYEVAPAVKSVRDEVVTIKPAGENVTANDYKGYVVIKDKTTNAELCKVALAQKNYYPEWIEAEGKQVEWAESFKISRYSDMSGAETKKGVFTFELSDNPAKGAYKVNNMFMAEVYYSNSQMVTKQGGVYYADVEGNTLTVYMDGAVKSYGFTSDLDLAYDAEDKAFTIATTVKAYNYQNSRDAYIADYAAAVKVEAPAQEGSIAGEWNQTASVGGSAAYATLTVAVDGNQVTFTNFLYEGVSVTGTLSGNTVTIPAYTMISDSTGPIMEDLVLTISADNKTITAPNFNVGGWIDVTGFTATKQGGAESSFDVTTICGEYWETFSGYWPTPGTTIIEVSDDPNYDVKITFFKPMYGSTYDVAYGTVNADGTVITIAAFTSNMFGPCSSFDINVKGTELSGNYAGALDYSATKK